ncbi:MAG: DNA ligase [Acidimicrobiia bacterium]|nr:DNA ligase [Acidimicrobiia bacterium]
MPNYLPMLAQTGSGTPPVGDTWLHELKWDGVRAVTSWDGAAVAMRSRNDNEMSATYPELARGARLLEPGVILDGEVVTLDADGVPSFELLQRRMNLHAPGLVREAGATVPVTYVVFDLLARRSESLVTTPLEERQAELAELELPTGFVLSAIHDDPDPIWQFAHERGVEGVVSKRRESLYRPGVRSPDWVKSVVFRSVRALVVGFTEGAGGRSGGFGALILGLRDGESMRWVGSVGSGFSESDVRTIRAALDQMATPETPFEASVQVPGQITWVEPALVAMVQYKQWTGAGRLRGPSFKGFTDSPPETITWEAEGPKAPG